MYTILDQNGFVLYAQLDQPKDGRFTELVVSEKFVKPKINDDETAFIEGATPEEIAEANKVVVPGTISRMKFIIQIFLTTGIKYEDIVLFIQNLNFDEAQKYVILTRLRSATHFDRTSSDLLTIAAMMQITEAQLDEIFINGNKMA